MLLVAAFLSACSPAADEPPAASTGVAEPANPPATEPTPPEDRELRDLLAARVGEGPGGLVALVVRDGIPAEAAAGTANAAGDPLTPETPSRVMSITKTFVATMVLQLVDEGRVSLDEPLSTYLPEAPVGADIPVRLLLNHRSGLPEYVHHHRLQDDMRADPDRAFRPEEVLAYVVDVPTTTPDRLFRYANTNYLLLGQLVERMDGTDLPRALQARIAGPLDLEATFLPAVGGEAPPTDVAANWWSERGEPVLTGDPDAAFEAITSTAWAAGGLVSTAGDLARFLTALVGGELVSEERLAEMTYFGPQGQGYGLGLHAASVDDGPTGYAHGGSGFGYSSFMAIEPGSGDLVVVLSNHEAIDAGEAAYELVAGG